ncbi:UNVERIFIED_CONTAM: peptidase C39-like protein [Acetivibrio alkalicellulosi]
MRAINVLTRKKKIFFAVLLIIIAIVFGSIGTYYSRALWIKFNGIKLVPSKAIEPIEVSYFLQIDPEWSKDRIGNTQYILGSSGCLISALASSMNKLGYETDPKQLNKEFSLNDVYTGNGEVIWYKINEVIPEIDYTYKRAFSRRTIENYLKQGLLPIVEVKFNTTGIFHWVLIVGSNNEDFLIFDPLYKDREPIELKKHGKVYSYRILIPSE